MFIKLTNAAADRRGDQLLLNLDAVISVYENHEEGGSLSTVLYGAGGLTWIVEESLGEVRTLIEQAQR